MIRRPIGELEKLADIAFVVGYRSKDHDEIMERYFLSEAETDWVCEQIDEYVKKYENK